MLLWASTLSAVCGACGRLLYLIGALFEHEENNKSQEFYSSSFNWLLAIFGIFLTIITVIFGIKLHHDATEIDKKIEETAQKTADKEKEKFETQIEEQRNRSIELAALVKDMQEKIILNWITQGRLAETQQQFYHEFMCYDFALKEIVDHFDKTFAQHGKISIEKTFGKSFCYKCFGKEKQDI